MAPDSKEEMEGEDSSTAYTALDASSSSFASTTLTEDSSAALTPSLTTKEALVRLWQALSSMPCLLIYISIITVISGALGWLDTALSEHLGKLSHDCSLYFFLLFFLLLSSSLHFSVRFSGGVRRERDWLDTALSEHLGE